MAGFSRTTLEVWQNMIGRDKNILFWLLRPLPYKALKLKQDFTVQNQTVYSLKTAQKQAYLHQKQPILAIISAKQAVYSFLIA